jgi:hypothetical protein
LWTISPKEKPIINATTDQNGDPITVENDKSYEK